MRIESREVGLQNFGGAAGWGGCAHRYRPRPRKSWRSGIKVCGLCTSCVHAVQWQQQWISTGRLVVLVVRLFGNKSGL